VNAVDPGATGGTQLVRHVRQPLLIRAVSRLFRKDAKRAAATQALLAASRGWQASAENFGADCRIAEGPALLGDVDLAKRLWEVSEESSTHTPCREITGRCLIC